MKQIRVGVFETNSSSTHSLTIVSEEEYNQWRDGKLLFDRNDEKLVPIPDDYEKLVEDDEDYDLLTYDRWTEQEMEDFTQHHTTKSGDKIVAFGQFGYDG